MLHYNTGSAQDLTRHVVRCAIFSVVLAAGQHCAARSLQCCKAQSTSAIPIRTRNLNNWRWELKGIMADLVLITLLLVANGFFVAAEFALVKARGFRIASLATQGRFGARLTNRILHRIEPYLAACQLGLTRPWLGRRTGGGSTFASAVCKSRAFRESQRHDFDSHRLHHPLVAAYRRRRASPEDLCDPQTGARLAVERVSVGDLLLTHIPPQLSAHQSHHRYSGNVRRA
ncbi:MAG: hypothetical protein ACI9DC_002131 [Gammaproteobacteria bacterium]|jgi:hypothetical protein